MNFKKNLFLFVILIFTMAACSKSGSDPSTGKSSATPPVKPTAADVYILGTTANGDAYWKNGVATELTGFSGYTCTSITVNGDDVYVTGNLKNSSGINTAAYWKNGVVTMLSDGSRSTEAKSIAVSGSDVYVAGFTDAAYINSVYNNRVGYFWKNGVASKLTDGTAFGSADAIVVNNNNIYIAGASGYYAVYWKNGAMTKLSDGTTNASAFLIQVNGSDVYTAGIVGISNANAISAGVCWKNGAVVAINDPGLDPVVALAVSGSDLYTAGYTTGASPETGAYWKNGVITVLPAPTAGTSYFTISGMAVYGTDVYVIENSGYWKNETYVQLPNCTATNGIAIVSQ